jgi:hypothetical protein
MTLTPAVDDTFATPASFVVVSGTPTQPSAVGGVRTEYAIELVPDPVATHVPFPNVIPLTSSPKMVGENEVGMATHDSAVGGLAREYEILFVPTPTATHTPFP